MGELRLPADLGQSMVRTVGPAAEPVLWADLQAQTRVTGDDEKTLGETYLTSAREWAEGYLARALITQTWVVRYECWREEFRLPRPPLQSVTSVTYVDAAGDSQTLDSANYQVDTTSEPGRVVRAVGVTYPELGDGYINPIVITYVAGYGDAATDVPAEIKQAIKLQAGFWFDCREAADSTGGKVKRIKYGVESLLWKYRMLDL